MTTRVILAVIVVLAVSAILDAGMHELLLKKSYEETKDLWRPTEQMKMWLTWTVGLVWSACFVCIYAFLVGPKGARTGLVYGLLFGLGAGVTMGFGSYSVMPIPLGMAVTWAVETLVKVALAGVLVGLIVKGKPTPAAAA